MIWWSRGAGQVTAVWHNMREEVCIYINGRPYVLREEERPFKNMQARAPRAAPLPGKNTGRCHMDSPGVPLLTGTWQGGARSRPSCPGASRRRAVRSAAHLSSIGSVPESALSLQPVVWLGFRVWELLERHNTSGC